MNIMEQFKQIFEPELLKEFEDIATHVSAKEDDIILNIGETVRVIPIQKCVIIAIIPEYLQSFFHS